MHIRDGTLLRATRLRMPVVQLVSQLFLPCRLFLSLLLLLTTSKMRLQAVSLKTILVAHVSCHTPILLPAHDVNSLLLQVLDSTTGVFHFLALVKDALANATSSHDAGFFFML